MTRHVAIVTGAARGIGRSIAMRLAHDGYAIAVADLDDESAQLTATEISKTHAGPAFALHVDVANSASAHRMIEIVLEHAGRIDLLINNAGIGGPMLPVVKYSDDAWQRIVATNLGGVFMCCRAVLPHMLERGSGRIVNIASIAGKDGNPIMAAYSATKAGVIGFTKALAKEVAKQGIYVNCVTPGVIDTDMAKLVPQELLANLMARTPLGRVGQPEEVAALVAWLASDECSFSTGAVFDISGGRATY